MKKKLITIMLVMMMAMLMGGCNADSSDAFKSSNTSDKKDDKDEKKEDEDEDKKKKEETYEVVFNLNGGELISGDTKQTVEKGNSATAPEVKNGTKKLSWDKDFSVIEEDMIINAVWTATTYKVTFRSGMDGIADVVVEVEEGTSASAPMFQADGLEQTGWDADFSSVTQDMTVTAQWAQKAMTGTQISDYAESRIVTVYVHDIYGNDGSGSGFFIDDEGTLVTNYHVIEFADKISIAFNNGAKYDVKYVVDFEEKFDLAVLKVDIKGNDYFNLTDTYTKGEQVYAIGSALGDLTGTMTSGIISTASRQLGLIDCIQMDAAISNGNSGGPLINVYGEVIGVNSFSLTSGNEINFAISIKMLDQMSMNRNFTLNDYVEWWRTEISRSYRPTNLDDTNYYQYSIVNTYQNYTNTPCEISMDAFDPNEVVEYAEGYDDNYWVYVYEYNQNDYQNYVNYLKSIGFVYDAELSGEDNDGTLSVYYSATSGHYMFLHITTEKGYMTMVTLQIAAVYV